MIQLLRLELLNLLVILKYPGAPQAIKDYLSERAWEISATAVTLLLTEGDESAVDIVKELLLDSNPRIRLQAALIISPLESGRECHSSIARGLLDK